MIKIVETQIGKQGITENFISTLKHHFKNHKIVRISVLKSARGEDANSKKVVKDLADKLVEHLGGNYIYKIIGFTIVLKVVKKSNTKIQ